MKSFAKLNLFLHIVGKRVNYHTLESLVVFLADLYDEIKIKRSVQNQVTFKGPYGKGISLESNTVKKVLYLAGKHIPDKFLVTVTKNIPHGAGLGGGSSNAACVLKYLIKQHSLNAVIAAKIAAKVGADVSMFMHGKASCIGGIGEKIIPIKIKMPKMVAVIVYPNNPISTAHVYGMGGFDFNLNSIPAFVGMTSEGARFMKEPIHSVIQATARPCATFCYPRKSVDPVSLIKFLQYTRNDLYPNSLKLFPELENILGSIKNLSGCLLARMTGSGSASFGIFHDTKDAELGLASLQKKFPQYSIYITRVV